MAAALTILGRYLLDAPETIYHWAVLVDAEDEEVCSRVRLSESETVLLGPVDHYVVARAILLSEDGVRYVAGDGIHLASGDSVSLSLAVSGD